MIVYTLGFKSHFGGEDKYPVIFHPFTARTGCIVPTRKASTALLTNVRSQLPGGKIPLNPRKMSGRIDPQPTKGIVFFKVSTHPK